MGFQSERPSNVSGPAVTEQNPLADLFSEQYVFGAQILPIEEDPGIFVLPNAPLTAEDEPQWVADDPGKAPTPAATSHAPVGANSTWLAFYGGSSTVTLPNGADIRSVFFQDDVVAPVTVSASYGGTMCVRDGPGVVPVPPGIDIVTITMPAVLTSPMWVYFSADILPPFNAGAGKGDIVYILPQPTAPGENATYTNNSTQLQLVSVGGIVAQAYVNSAIISGGQPATYALRPGDTLRLTWGYDNTVAEIGNLLHYWAGSDLPPTPNAGESSGFNVCNADVPGFGVGPVPLNNVVGNTQTQLKSVRGGPPLTSDGAVSTFVNQYALNHGSFGLDVQNGNNGLLTNGLGDWPDTPSGSWSICGWFMIPSTAATIQNSEIDAYSETLHPLVCDTGDRPRISTSPGFNSVAQGFCLYANFYDPTVPPAIFVSLRDSGQTTLPEGYSGNPISAGFYWRTAPAMNDFGSTAVAYDKPFFVCVTYDGAAKTLKLQVGQGGVLHNPVISDGATTPQFGGPTLAIGSVTGNGNVGGIFYFSKFIITDGPLGSPVTLFDQGTDEANPVFQFYEVAS